MDKDTRNKLRNTVVQCRKLLEDDILGQLEGTFGIHRDGRIEEESALPHLDDEGSEVRQRAVAAIDHIQGYGLEPPGAVDQFQREVAFTHLNRLCAFKMLERRGLLDETVSRGASSNGFKVYLAAHRDDERLWQTGNEYEAYKHFLFDVCRQLTEEIKVLFDTEHISSHLFPSWRTLEAVLEQINAEPLADIWDQDETIGWIYQYFTPKELREKARKESAAPRNSYELAFRNQFYTPRYVVEFLTDNTLGRTWYEMRKGETRLVDQCEYMVRRPTEIFLKPGEEPPEEPATDGELSQEKLLKQPVHIAHREKKLPWEIKVLDPACGSGHFLLYAFDLLETIYDEAWDDPDIGAKVRETYPDRSLYLTRVPGIILRHNLHGIDIDLRSTQIAALALWMRAQRSYQRLGLEGEAKPRIEKTNIVCAEPMSGSQELLDEFCESLSPSVLGDLVRDVWEKMQLAGEVGSLLKIEEEIGDVVKRAQEEWRKAPKGYNVSLFDGTIQRPIEQTEFDFTDLTGPVFWGKAEALLLDALELFANRAANGRQYGRRLFADDAEQGFAFIDLCRRSYDVVLMNPPFGSTTTNTDEALPLEAGGNLYAAFALRWLSRLGEKGRLGCITDRTFLLLPTYQPYRDAITATGLIGLTDLGWNVLDALVATCAYVLTHTAVAGRSWFYDLRNSADKADALQSAIRKFQAGSVASSSLLARDEIEAIPTHPIVHWAPSGLRRAFRELPSLEPNYAIVRKGLSPGDSDRYVRAWWEVPPADRELGAEWAPYANGGSFSPYYRASEGVTRWGRDGEQIRSLRFPDGRPRYVIRSPDLYGTAGLTYGKRGEILNVQALPAGQVFSNEGYLVLPAERDINWVLLGYVNSSPARFLVNMICGLHKEVGALKVLPTPPDLARRGDFEEGIKRAYEASRRIGVHAETNPEFLFWSLPRLAGGDDLGSFIRGLAQELNDLREQVIREHASGDEIVSEALGLSEADTNLVLEDLKSARSEIRAPTVELSAHAPLASLLSWALGAVIGRWDVRMGVDDSLVPDLQGPFDQLPKLPPAALVGADGLPAEPGRIVSEEWLRARPNAITLPSEGSVRSPTIADDEYPQRIVWDGILADDQEHEDDVVRCARSVLELLWPDNAPAVEQEACEILGVKSLRDYFRNPKHFWTDHIKRYSKSRRKAPIYWLLQSPNRHYALWIYYHRLDKDIYFKALRNYVDPKLRLEQNRLKQLQDSLAGTPEGRERKTLEKQIDDQEALANDVMDFQERLAKVAQLGLEPDLNDGVVLNIASLHELVPWKEPKKYWDELLAGKYEWSTIGKQLREKGLVRG